MTSGPRTESFASWLVEPLRKSPGGSYSVPLDLITSWHEKGLLEGRGRDNFKIAEVHKGNYSSPAVIADNHDLEVHCDIYWMVKT